MSEKNSYDIAIIGAGITGCAVAQRLARYQVDVVMIEKEADVSDGATKANSGIIHAGYFTTEGSMKEKMCLEGYLMFEDVCKDIGVDLKRTGALFCSVDDKKTQVLETELEKSKKKGIRVELIKDKKKIQEMEPQISDNVCAVLHYPDAGIIVPFELAVGLAEHAVINGVNLKLNWEVGFIHRKGDIFQIHSVDNRTIEAKTIINCAGIYSDKIAQMIGISQYHITPRRGEYVLFDRDSMPLKKVLFPTPTPESKGILVAPTMHNNFYIGPNAHEVDSKDTKNTSIEGMNELIDLATQIVKDLPLRKTITNFAGLRATERYKHDFIIEESAPQFVSAIGIESPGLSSCLAIAKEIERILEDDCGYKFLNKPNYKEKRFVPTRLADLSDEELAEHIKKNPQWGNMVCRCEHVTEAEIVNACHAPIPCETVDMVKRRLRAGMGRCQGGFCRPKVMKIISRERKMLYEQVTKKGPNSRIVGRRTKNLISEVFSGDKL